MAVVVPPGGSEHWLTPWPSFCEGVQNRPRTLCAYGNIVRALPDGDSRKREFACPCCPSSPALSLYCWLTVGLPIPHVQTLLCGLWVAAAKTRRLRALLAPDEQPQQTVCHACVHFDQNVLQMEREVAARRAAGVPILPQARAAPVGQKMVL